MSLHTRCLLLVRVSFVWCGAAYVSIVLLVAWIEAACLALCATELNERVASGDSSLARSIYFWGGNIRGSDAYNATLHREIDALITHMLQQPEPAPPSMFVTFSCAEFYWKPMLSYLAQHVQAVERLDSVPDLLSEQNKSLKFRLLQDYAHVVTLFFEQRVMSYIVDVLTKTFGITVRYSVMEFADGRGQIHLHMLIWLKDGEPHRLVHDNTNGVLDEIDKGGAAAAAAWVAAIQARDAYDARHIDRHNAASPYRPPPAPLASRTTPPDSILAGGHGAVRAWNAFVLERWMREHNIRADHPAGTDRSQWPAPEGSMPPPPVADGASPLSQLRVEVVENGDPVGHLRNVVNTVKIHRCRRSYCLRTLRRGPFKGLLDCAKGGFGLEAPLVGHRVTGAMAPMSGGDVTERVGVATRFESSGTPPYYVVRVMDDDRIAMCDEEGSRLFVCQLEKARPVGSEQCHDQARRCSGCDAAPPMGKPARDEPALIEEEGVLKIELPRQHPRVVQGCWVVDEWWMGNNDGNLLPQCTRAMHTRRAG